MTESIFLLEVESIHHDWKPVSFCLTQEAADLAIKERHKGEGRYQLVYRIREFVPKEE